MLCPRPDTAWRDGVERAAAASSKQATNLVMVIKVQHLQGQLCNPQEECRYILKGILSKIVSTSVQGPQKGESMIGESRENQMLMWM